MECKNPKLFWSTINELAGIKKCKDAFSFEKFKSGSSQNQNLKMQIVNDFNSFFTSVGPNLANSFTNQGAPVVNDEDYVFDSNFSLTLITELDLRSYVMTLRGGSADRKSVV